MPRRPFYAKCRGHMATCEMQVQMQLTSSINPQARHIKESFRLTRSWLKPWWQWGMKVVLETIAPHTSKPHPTHINPLFEDRNFYAMRIQEKHSRLISTLGYTPHMRIKQCLSPSRLDLDSICRGFPKDPKQVFRSTCPH